MSTSCTTSTETLTAHPRRPPARVVTPGLTTARAGATATSVGLSVGLDRADRRQTQVGSTSEGGVRLHEGCACMRRVHEGMRRGVCR